MQDRNEEHEILNAKTGKLDDLLKEPMPAKAVSRTIALLPDQGDVVKFRGLDFVVRYVNKRTGKLHLEIRDAEQRNGADLPQHSDADREQPRFTIESDGWADSEADITSAPS